MIESNIQKLRDPFVLVEDDAYYIYGTDIFEDNWDEGSTWVCYKNTEKSLDGAWIPLSHPLAVMPEDATKQRWAPEVHKVGGRFYLIGTYYSELTQHRGCAIFTSDTPEGPFTLHSDGHVTPKEWDAIDGTLYIDEENQPWMVFVHEWTCTDDGIGRMAAAKLSPDFKRLISEPIELFRADAPSWTNHRVTDGCFMHKAKNGELLMIWSNFDERTEDVGYCVGVCRSQNGKIDGKWVQDDALLYAKDIFGTYDGGHGMLFFDRDGTLYLSLHSPNLPDGDREEKPVFIPVCDENGTLTVIK